MGNTGICKIYLKIFYLSMRFLSFTFNYVERQNLFNQIGMVTGQIIYWVEKEGQKKRGDGIKVRKG
jgi:hypothetical protein